MLKTSIRCLLLGLLLLSAAQAEIVPDFYQQQELVTDQGTAERQRAISRALERMIVRASGSTDAMSSVSSRLSSNPAATIEAYRYESSDEVVMRAGEPVPASRLIVNFSKPAIEKILRSAGLPIWSSNRPSVLIWLVRDDFSAGRQFVSLQGDSEVADAVRAVATERGLPIIVPLLDLEDRLNISPDKLWSLDEAAIIEASARYRSDVVVVGRYSQASSGKWLATWSLGHQERREIFDLEAESELDAMEQGIGAVTDYLASWYAIQPGAHGGGYLNVQLQRVQSFADYVNALSYLKGMDIIREANLVAVKDDRVSLQLVVEGDVQSLLDALALDRKLIPAATISAGQNSTVDALASGSEGNPLRFIWTRQ